MKKILITGANSYIGTSFEKWLSQYSNLYNVDTLDLKNDEWRYFNLSEYNVVFHVAGIVHEKEKKNNTDSYYAINRDLAYEIAKKAKDDGVKQFVFMSSMSVYGIENETIDANTVPNPKSNYGKSKLQAERLLVKLEDSYFNVAILRPPMVYGEGCKGNYTRIKQYILKYPVFPKIENKRSMIYINNLCEFIRIVIDNDSRGVFFPQNEEYVCSTNLVEYICKAHNKTTYFTKLFNPIIKCLRLATINKLFGNLIYVKEISVLPQRYCLIDFRDSIFRTEGYFSNEIK